MNGYFQSDQAIAFFQTTADEMRPIVIEQDGVRCVATVMQRLGCRWAIVQGGLAIDETISLPALHQTVLSLLRQLTQRIKEARCAFLEFRNFQDYSAYRADFEAAGFTFLPHYDAWISLKDDPWNHLHPSKQRTLRKLEAEGITWREANSEVDVQSYYRLLRVLYRKIMRPLPSLSWFIHAWKNGVKLLVTEQNGMITGGVLMPCFEGVVYEWYICGGIMSTWAMICWAKNHNMDYVDMMGAGRPDKPYGVRRFKQEMGAELKEFGRFLYVFRPLTYNLGALVMK